MATKYCSSECSELETGNARHHHPVLEFEKPRSHVIKYLATLSLVLLGAIIGLCVKLAHVEIERSEYLLRLNEVVLERDTAHYIHVVRSLQGGVINKIVYSKCQVNAACHVSRHHYLCFCEGRTFEGEIQLEPPGEDGLSTDGQNSSVKISRIFKTDCIVQNLVRLREDICRHRRCPHSVRDGWYVPVRQRLKMTGAWNTVLEMLQNKDALILPYSAYSRGYCVHTSADNSKWKWTVGGPSWLLPWFCLDPRSTEVEHVIYIKAGVMLEVDLLLKGRGFRVKPTLTSLQYRGYDVAHVFNKVLDVWEIASADTWREVAQSGVGATLLEISLKIRYCTAHDGNGRLRVDPHCTVLPVNRRNALASRFQDFSHCTTNIEACIETVNGQCLPYEVTDNSRSHIDL